MSSLAAVRERLRALFVGEPPLALRAEDEQKAVEVAALLAEAERVLGARGQRRVVDAAAGKAPVGLLLADLLGERLVELTVIERDPERAAACRRAATALRARVVVVEGEVGDAGCWPARPDLVVALHACGAATDAVIDRAIAAEARHLLLVPCCYGAAPARARDAAPATGTPPGQGIAETAARALGIPRQAQVGRRFAQALIDAERTLRLEARGYRTEVVELVAPRVTPFNLLFRARRVGEPRQMAAAAERLERLRRG